MSLDHPGGNVPAWINLCFRIIPSPSATLHHLGMRGIRRKLTIRSARDMKHPGPYRFPDRVLRRILSGGHPLAKVIPSLEPRCGLPAFPLLSTVTSDAHEHCGDTAVIEDIQRDDMYAGSPLPHESEITPISLPGLTQ